MISITFDYTIIVKIDKCRSIGRLNVIAVLVVVGLGGIAVTIAPPAFGNAVPSLAVGGHACMIYQTYPSQAVCTGSTSPSSLLKV
jgi:hypothetical protein